MVNYLHKMLVRIPTVCTSSVTSVIAPVSALSVPSVHLSDDKCQEILDKFHSTNYGEKHLAQIMATITADVTITLHQVKFQEKTLVILKWLISQ